MVTDPGVFLRLKSSIDATLAGMPDKTNAAKALADAYATFRSEVARVAEDNGVTAEFDRLFPAPTTLSHPSIRGGYDPFAAASHANEALSTLTRLSGWLDGFVQQVRLDTEANAYAETRLRQERSD